MIFLIQFETLATFVKTPGRPTGQNFISLNLIELQEVIPITVAFPSTFLIKPPELFKTILTSHWNGIGQICMAEILTSAITLADS